MRGRKVVLDIAGATDDDMVRILNAVYSSVIASAPHVRLDMEFTGVRIGDLNDLAERMLPSWSSRPRRRFVVARNDSNVVRRRTPEDEERIVTQLAEYEAEDDHAGVYEIDDDELAKLIRAGETIDDTED